MTSAYNNPQAEALVLRYLDTYGPATCILSPASARSFIQRHRSKAMAVIGNIIDKSLAAARATPGGDAEALSAPLARSNQKACLRLPVRQTGATQKVARRSTPAPAQARIWRAMRLSDIFTYWDIAILAETSLDYTARYIIWLSAQTYQGRPYIIRVGLKGLSAQYRCMDKPPAHVPVWTRRHCTLKKDATKTTQKGGEK